MRALKITTDFTITEIELHEPLYKTIRVELGGRMEIVRPRRMAPPLVMIVDEEGLLKELPLNTIGSYLYETDKHNQPIVGDIIIMQEAMGIDGIDLVGLEQSQIDQLTLHFGNMAKFFSEPQCRGKA